MHIRLIDFSWFLTTLFTAFYAGTGFFVIMGGNPAILKMSSRTFAEYWQHTDFYMAARMKIFGPLLLFILLTAVLLHISEWRTPTFWLLLMAFLILMADLAFVFTTNHPLNRLIQGWDVGNLPSTVQEIKLKVVNAFWYRSSFMIGSFVCVLLALFFRSS